MTGGAGAEAAVGIDPADPLIRPILEDRDLEPSELALDLPKPIHRDFRTMTGITGFVVRVIRCPFDMQLQGKTF